MTVEICVAVTWKMFRTSCDTTRLHRLNERSCALRYNFGIAAERARTDDGIGSIAIDIDNRREVHIEIRGAKFASKNLSDASGFCGTSNTKRANFAHRREDRHAFDQANDTTTFMVDRCEDLWISKRSGFALDCTNQLPRSCVRRCIASKQNHTTHTCAQHFA